MKKRVVVGMSGGVDSAVAACPLKEQGVGLVGRFMSHREGTEPHGAGPGGAEWAEVARVCDHIGIPYYSVDFSAEYMERVFRLFLDEYRKGRTPNPYVLCNREVKFGPLVKFARGLGRTALQRVTPAL